MSDIIAKGKLQNIKDWLRDNIHQYGAVYSPQELQKKVFGKLYDPKPLLQYLSSKFFSMKTILLPELIHLHP